MAIFSFFSCRAAAHNVSIAANDEEQIFETFDAISNPNR